MAVWRINLDPHNLYFITTRAIQRAPIFRRDVMKQIIVDSLAYMRSEAWLELYAFVIMPNHIHVIVRCLPEHPVSDVVRDFKKFTSKAIVRQYEQEKNDQVLSFLRSAVIRPSKQEYAVWEGEYQAKDVFSPEFLKQKIEYIHNNPLQSHWRLADRAEDYWWSSASFYLCDKPALIPLDDARQWL